MEPITDKIPENLLYEEFGGRKYYRRGYRQVLLGLKKEDEIMGSSIFQSLIVQAVVFYLKTILPIKKYWTPTNEAGLHLGRKDNLANDIVIVEKKAFSNPTSLNYSNIPPKFIIEVDIKIDPKDYSDDPPAGSEMAYMVQKSEKLIEFGVEGVAWILTESRKILLMRLNRRLEIFEWTDQVPLFDDYTLCLQTILEEEDILPPSE
ncbi:MAG: hypothetical protein KKG00_04605 [Bacteroidetes bacterium]|nr:hypothetical protein [Bacteroidota bacterium]